MACLTTKAFKSCGKTKQGHHEPGQPDRFANYKFIRSEVVKEAEEM